MTARSTLLLAAALPFALAGCLAGPGSRTYLLRSASLQPLAATQNPGLPVLELEPVLVPDYLDSTDLLLRQGEHRLEASRSAHWGERLSSGITEVLQADLARRLPGEWVTSARAGGEAEHRLGIRIERFDVWPDGHCVLVASWIVHGRSRADASVSDRDAVELAATSRLPVTDARLVAAMDDTLETLATRIADSIKER